MMIRGVIEKRSENKREKTLLNIEIEVLLYLEIMTLFMEFQFHPFEATSDKNI